MCPMLTAHITRLAYGSAYWESTPNKITLYYEGVSSYITETKAMPLTRKFDRRASFKCALFRDKIEITVKLSIKFWH